MPMLRFERIGLTDMARGPRGEYRPNDPIAVAAVVARIAMGQSNEAAEAAKLQVRPRTKQPKSTQTLELRLKTRER